MEREACPTDRRNGELSRESQVAKIERRRGDETAKLGKRSSRKRQANKQVVHINRLKPAHGYHTQDSKPQPQRKNKTRIDSTGSNASREDLSAIKIGAFPLALEAQQQDNALTNEPTPESVSSQPNPLDTPFVRGTTRLTDQMTP